MLHALTFVLLAVAPAPVLAPVPTGPALAQAEATVQEVFGRDLERARKPAERAALARKMIDTAAGSSPAERYALLVQARDLAIAAGDAAVGVQAVEGLVGFRSQGSGARDAAAIAAEGHRLWNEAKKGDLKARLAAAEIYLRCLPALKGFERTAVEKRLRELGWRVGPIDFEFDESTEGWKGMKDVVRLEAKAGRLVGSTRGTELFVIREGLNVKGDACPFIRIRMAVTFGHRAQIFWTTRESPRWADDKYLDFPFQADGQLRHYTIPVGSHRLWAGQTITGLRFDVREGPRDPRKEGTFQIDSIRGSDEEPRMTASGQSVDGPSRH